MTALTIVVFLTIFMSCMCSLFEATLYSTRMGALETRANSDSSTLARRMMRMKNEIAIPISAILIVNTVANTAGATFAGMYADQVLGSAWVPLFSVLLTLSILFFSEIIPKTVGAVHWRTLWPFTVWPLTIMEYALYPVIRFNQWLTRSLTHGQGGPQVTEEDILGVIKLGAKEGQITEWESRMAHNIMEMEDTLVREIMTPRTVLFSLDDTLTVKEALPLALEKHYTRVPIYKEDTPDEITGYVTLPELASVTTQEQPDRKLSAIAKPVVYVPTTANCAALLTRFLRGRIHLAIVMDEYGGLAGVVTLEDLLETVLGAEIVDERDAVADLQAFARHRSTKRK